jgi:tetratricopeptide (TPR) repeat protein
MQPDHSNGPSLSLSVARRIDAVCVRFEAAWRAGQAPRIEDFLGDTQQAERETLLWELLRIEIDHRLRRGDVPTVADYLGRFPNRDRLLREEIEERVARAAGNPRPGETMATHGTGAGDSTLPSDGWPTPPVAVPGYEIRGPLGEGGMAQVFRVHDPDFDRPLAIKVMKAGLAHSAEARFLTEARITARLQHPGIPPVHEIGRLADGRPFLAMKLIEGQTLNELLRQRAAATSELPRFVAIFEQVCQTIGYAHSQGVIHRDLKPANIMVGAFGEVQVMDWGLAREKTTRETAAVLGTPAFMAPEQARGEIDRMDERADVFGLGAILCVILTGEPPFVGMDASDVLGQAANGSVDSSFVRLGACPADDELIALAMRCLAPNPEQRPSDGSAVAAAVQAYQTGVEERARKAEMEWATAQARAEEATAKAKAERRARRLTLGLAVALLLVVVGGGIGAWVIQQQRAATAAGIRTEMGQSQRLGDEGWQQNNLAKLIEAKLVAERAVAVAHGSNASAALQHQAESQLAEINKKLRATQKNNAGLDAWLNLRGSGGIRPMTTPSGQTVAVADGNPEEQFAKAFGHWGVNPDKDLLEDVVAHLKAQPEPVVQEVVNCLDSWALQRRRYEKLPEAKWRPLLAIAERLDRDPGRRKMRRLLASSPLEPTLVTATAWAKTRADLVQESKKLNAAAEPVQSLLARVRVLNVFNETAMAEELLRSCLARHPREVAVLVLLGTLLQYQESPQLEQAIGCYRAARSLRPQLGITLGVALMRANQARESLAIFEDVKRLQHVTSDLATPNLDFYLGNALSLLKKLDAAAAAYKKAIERKPDFFDAYNNLGITLRAQKKLDEAVAAYHKGIEFNRKAIELYPQNLDLRYTLARLYSNLGFALENQKKHAEAMAAYRKAIDTDPEFAAAYSNLGLALQAQKKLDEAVLAYKKAIKVQPNDFAAYSNLGTALYEQKKLDEAVDAFRTALKLKPDRSGLWYNLGNALRTQKKLEEAVLAYQQAIRFQSDSVEAHHNLGLALADQNKLAEAAAAFRRAIKHRPTFADAYHNLGNALYYQNKLGEAVDAYKKAIELKPEEVESYLALGNTPGKQKKFDEAADVFRRAIKVKPDFAAAHFNLGNALKAQQKLDEAVDAYRQAIKVKPDFATAYVGLGNTLAAQNKLDEAVVAYRRAIVLKPDDAQTYHNLGAVLYNQKKLAEVVATFRQAAQRLPNHPLVRQDLQAAELWLELDRKLPLIQAGKEQPRSTQERIELAYFCFKYKQHHATAVGFYRDAFAAEPRLADNLQAQHRYRAASAAVLAAAGKREDATGLSAEQRGKLRQQARAWLRADLGAYASFAAKEDRRFRPAVRQRLSFWLRDDNLATVRDAKALAALPEQERKEWQQLWEEVAALLKKCR